MQLLQSTIRVLVVDDHELVRQAICTLLKSRPDLDIVGEAANGKEAIELAQSLRPDVIVMDVRMPEMNGIEATQWIKRTMPEIAIVGLTVSEEAQVAEAMKKAGASDCLRKGGSSQELFDAVARLASGGATDGDRGGH